MTGLDYGRAGYARSLSGMRMEAMALFADGFYNESERKIAEARKILQSRKENGWHTFETTLLDLVDSRLHDARTRRNQSVELEPAPVGQFAEVLRRNSM